MLTLQNLCKATNYGIDQFDHFKQAGGCEHKWYPRVVYSGKSIEEQKREEEFLDVVGKIDKNVITVYNS